MQTFTVEVTRIGYATKEIEVDAETQEEANQKALNEAGNYVFDEQTSDYELTNEPNREDNFRNLLKEIHDEIGRLSDESSELNEASEFPNLENSDIMLRIRKALGMGE